MTQDVSLQEARQLAQDFKTQQEPATNDVDLGQARELAQQFKSEQKPTGGLRGFGESVLSGAIRSALITPAKAFAHIGGAVPGELGLPFKIAQALQSRGVQPIDPTQKFVGKPGELLGEVGGAFALPVGRAEELAARVLPRVLRAPAVGAGLGAIGGAAQGQQLSGRSVGIGAGIGAGLGALAGSLQKPISKIGAAIERTALGSRMENLFKDYMGRLRGDLTPEQAEIELQKVATQKPQANKFVGDLLGDEKFSSKSQEKNPEVLRQEVTDLNKSVNDEAKSRYNKAFSMAEKGGRFGIVFPTAAQSAKNILQREKDFAGFGVPKADVDNALGTVQGIAKGGIKIDPVTGRTIGLEKDPITRRPITTVRQQTFQTATETMKRLKEMSNRFRKEDNLTASGLLGSLAKDVESDTENALKEHSPEALDAWRDSNKYWRRNVLPLRTKTIQKATVGAGEAGDLKSDLLNTDNKDLPAVLNQLSPQGKKALAFQEFKNSIEQKRGTTEKEVNPKKLFNAFSKYDNEHLPFMRSLIGEKGIGDLRDVGAGRLVGIDETVERLAKGLGNVQNAQSIRKLPETDKNIVLFNHLKDAMTPEQKIDPGMLIKKLDQLHPAIRRELTGTGTEGERNLNDLERFSRSELIKQKIAKAAEKPFTKKVIKGLGTAALAGGGVEALRGETGRGAAAIGLGLLPLLPAAVREHIMLDPKVNLNILRALRTALQRSALPAAVGATRKPIDLTLTRGRQG